MAFQFDAVADILACPECHGELRHINDTLVCCSDCSDQRYLQFPIVDGIPRLLLEEATELTKEQWEQLQQQDQG